MQAHTEPQTRPCWSSSRLTWAGSMWAGSSTGISTVSKPHFLNCLKSFVLSLVKGEVKRNVLMPNLIMIVESLKFKVQSLKFKVSKRELSFCRPVRGFYSSSLVSTAHADALIFRGKLLKQLGIL